MRWRRQIADTDGSGYPAAPVHCAGRALDLSGSSAAGKEVRVLQKQRLCGRAPGLCEYSYVINKNLLAMGGEGRVVG